MVSENNIIIQIVIKKSTKKFLQKLAKYCNTSISAISNYLIENQIVNYSNLDDKGFVESLQKIIKEFQK